MKINKLLLALVISLTSLVSCSKEVPINDSSEPIVTEQEHYLSVSIDATTDELRLAQVVGANGAIVSPFMEERDLVIRLTVRKKDGDPNQVKIQDVVFTKTPPDPRTGAKQLRATYTGRIKLPNGLTPKAGDIYEVCGILLREATDPGTEFLTPGTTLWEPVSVHSPTSFNPLTEGYLNNNLVIADSESKVAANIPYLADWTDMTISNDASRFEFTTMNFNPSGAIIRFRLHNPLPEEKTITAISIKTNMFFTNWKYDPKNPFAKGNLLAGYRDDLEVQELSIALPDGPIVLPPNNGVSDKDYYMRVMPTGSNTPKHLEIFLYDTNYEPLLAFDSHNKLKAGSTLINLHMRTFTKTTGSFRPLLEGSTLLETPGESEVKVKNGFRGGRLPIEYLALHNIGPSGKGFVINRSDFSGYFTKKDALAIKIPGYYLPSYSEWLAILPRVDGSFRDVSEERITIPGYGTMGPGFTADYKRTGDGLYAIRYRGGDNSLLTAYRYTLTNTFQPGDWFAGMLIESRFLGPDLAYLTVDDIAFTHFFENRSETKSRFLPAAGDRLYDTSRPDEIVGVNGTSGMYWTYNDNLSVAFSPSSLRTDIYSIWFGVHTVRLFCYTPVNIPPDTELGPVSSWVDEYGNFIP